MKIKFLGAAGMVTGSGYLVTANTGEKVLIDLGMFQGPAKIDKLNYLPLEFDCASLSAIVLTHAHLDHCGRMAMVEKFGFKGKVYLTAPTAELVELSLLDSAKISLEDHPEKTLYGETEISELVKKFVYVEYGKEFGVGNIKITLRDAGHIIGAASVELEADGQKVVFSGDLGNTPEDLTEPTEAIKSADVVVMESTYGDRLHPAGEADEIILAEINLVEKTGGTLLIPAFSLDETQELLHIIQHLKADGKVKTETMVFLDSPMAEKATIIYEKYRKFLNNEVNMDFENADLFDFAGLNVIKDRRDSQKISKIAGTKVIIAGSGMMMGGRIMEHARHFLPSPDTRLLIVGYQAEGTLGRELLDGSKDVRIGKQQIHVNANVSDTQVMSSHADQSQLLNWLKNISGVKKVILTHGENTSRNVLAEKIKTELKITDVIMPIFGQEVEF